ncbi:STAS domain-containing protein [Novosphingobium taihuense]|uniref:Anti-anti-sigma regulatory factor n=1 Tax=Novosphingobium taihuense TaxID=260085 RepID=A0A7W7ABU2_9SPHN|nr:STAS domain-containing protein [Novosphingobium taihuense]MBB4613395.1 anti-anti-sigma regulatory factor [Novosphingobium taihuense]TWH80901.1 STAS domain-containing protein [Novosphingobium taihuense]
MAMSVGPTANLGNISQVCAAILENLATDDASTLDCSSLTDVDLTFLQVLAATAKFAERDGKSVSLLQPAEPAMAALIDRAGFDGLDGFPWNSPSIAGATGQ